ncbi:LysR family transcriptional regulator [Peptoniphilus catoniae]|uniref:LysR family transcriptional regulator n=1 Tax=Peptoniphilus catoniae TaxID=1660341 RepID=UPI0010FE0584|nr:LysR family transcriptional regulator [Peptoniphilus catoniae]
MNIFQIEAFLKTIELGNMTKAAECLFISQSTLSERISKLEKELNKTLFTRGYGYNGVKLTADGEEFIIYAKKYLSVLDDIKDWSHKDKVRTNIRISGPYTTNTYFLDEFFKKYLDGPIKLDISSHWNHTIYNMISTYEIDLGLVSRPYASPYIKTSPLFLEPLVIIYNKDFSDYSHINSISEIKKEDEIHLDWGPDYDLWSQRFWNQTEVPKITVDSPELLISFLRSKNSWAIVPTCIINYLKMRGADSDLITKNINLTRKMYLVSQRDSSELVNELKFDLIDFLREKEKNQLCKMLI